MCGVRGRPRQFRKLRASARLSRRLVLRWPLSLLRLHMNALDVALPDAPLASVYQILDEGLVALVMDGSEFVGLITRTDLVNFMRRRLR